MPNTNTDTYENLYNELTALKPKDILDFAPVLSRVYASRDRNGLGKTAVLLVLAEAKIMEHLRR